MLCHLAAAPFVQAARMGKLFINEGMEVYPGHGEMVSVVCVARVPCDVCTNEA